MGIAAANVAYLQPYDPGASDTEIMLGQTVPFSGPVSVAGSVGHASLAYFKMVNRDGGIHGGRLQNAGGIVSTTRAKDSHDPPWADAAVKAFLEWAEIHLIQASPHAIPVWQTPPRPRS